MTFDSIIESYAAAAKVIQDFLGGGKCKPWRKSEPDWDLMAADPAVQEKEARAICNLFGGRLKFKPIFALVRDGLLDMRRTKMMIKNEMSSRLVE